jgi:hypothetical protein
MFYQLYNLNVGIVLHEYTTYNPQNKMLLSGFECQIHHYSKTH